MITSLEMIFAKPLSATLFLPNCENTVRVTHYSPNTRVAYYPSGSFGE